MTNSTANTRLKWWFHADRDSSPHWATGHGGVYVISVCGIGDYWNVDHRRGPQGRMRRQLGGASTVRRPRRSPRSKITSRGKSRLADSETTGAVRPRGRRSPQNELKRATMSQRVSGFARIADERYETVEAWPARALLTQLPDIGWAWDPADDGDGHLVATLHREGIKAVGSGHDFLCVTEPPMAGVTDIICIPIRRRAPRRISDRVHPTRADTSDPAHLNVAADRLRFRGHPTGRVPVLLRLRRQDHLAQSHPLDFGSTGSPSVNHAWFCWDKSNEAAPTIRYISKREVER